MAGKASENGQHSDGIAKCHTDKTVGGHKLCFINPSGRCGEVYGIIVNRYRLGRKPVNFELYILYMYAFWFLFSIHVCIYYIIWLNVQSGLSKWYRIACFQILYCEGSMCDRVIIKSYTREAHDTYARYT